MEKKKNDAPYIIPAVYFRNNKIEQKPKSIQPSESILQENTISNEEKTTIKRSEVEGTILTEGTLPANPSTTSSPTVIAEPAKRTKENTTNTTNRSNIGTSTSVVAKKKTSGLSLSSIRKKKEHQNNKVQEVIDPGNLPETAFTEVALKKAWLTYGKIQDRKGEMIIGSMFAMNVPKKDGNQIIIELPNNSMKADLEQVQSAFLQYIYKELDNYKIELVIKVNEEVSKKYAFTPQDKYEKLREKNPLIDKLRSEFDLDI